MNKTSKTIGPSLIKGAKAAGNVLRQPFLSVCDSRKACSGPGCMAAVAPKTSPCNKKTSNCSSPKYQKQLKYKTPVSRMIDYKHLVIKVFMFVSLSKYIMEGSNADRRIRARGIRGRVPFGMSVLCVADQLTLATSRSAWHVVRVVRLAARWRCGYCVGV